VVILGQFRARPNKRDHEAIPGERPATVCLRLSLECPYVFLHPKAARPAPETSQPAPVSRSAQDEADFDRPLHVFCGVTPLFAGPYDLSQFDVPAPTVCTSRGGSCSLWLSQRRRAPSRPFLHAVAPTARLEHPYEGAPCNGVKR